MLLLRTGRMRRRYLCVCLTRLIVRLVLGMLTLAWLLLRIALLRLLIVSPLRLGISRLLRLGLAWWAWRGPIKGYGTWRRRGHVGDRGRLDQSWHGRRNLGRLGTCAIGHVQRCRRFDRRSAGLYGCRSGDLWRTFRARRTGHGQGRGTEIAGTKLVPPPTFHKGHSIAALSRAWKSWR